MHYFGLNTANYLLDLAGASSLRYFSKSSISCEKNKVPELNFIGFCGVFRISF